MIPAPEHPEPPPESLPRPSLRTLSEALPYTLAGLAFEGYKSYYSLFHLGWRAIPAGIRKYLRLMRAHRPRGSFRSRTRAVTNS